MTAMKRICKNSKIKNQRKQTGMPSHGYAGILMGLKQNPEHRLLWMAAGSLCLNLTYVFYNGLLGVTYQSLWFVTLCMYYGVLSFMRFIAVVCGLTWWRSETADGLAAVLCGCLLTILSFVLMGAQYLSWVRNRAAVYDEILMITIAAYTFYKLTWTIIRVFRKQKRLLFQVIGNISLAEAAVSVLTLQRSMIASFGAMGQETARLMNGLTGVGVCLFAGGLGVRMIQKGIGIRRKLNGKIKIC